MSDAYVIQVRGRTAGIVARDAQGHGFNFFSAAPRFNVMEGQHFSDPSAAECAAQGVGVGEELDTRHRVRDALALGDQRRDGHRGVRAAMEAALEGDDLRAPGRDLA